MGSRSTSFSVSSIPSVALPSVLSIMLRLREALGLTEVRLMGIHRYAKSLEFVHLVQVSIVKPTRECPFLHCLGRCWRYCHPQRFSYGINRRCTVAHRSHAAFGQHRGTQWCRGHARQLIEERIYMVLHRNLGEYDITAIGLGEMPLTIEDK